MYGEARLKHSALLAMAAPVEHRERLEQLQRHDRLRRSLVRIQAQLGYAITPGAHQPVS